MKRVFVTSVLAAAVSAAFVLPAGAQEGEAEAPEVERRAIVRAAAPAARGGFLGVRLQDVDEEVVERLDLPQERGALVVEVAEGSPAAESGIREDDIIFEWKGEAVESVAELTRLVRETPPGREVDLRVFREGASRDLRVEVGESVRASAVVRPEGVPSAPRLDEERAERMRERMDRVRQRTERARERTGRAMERMREHHVDMEGMSFFGGGSGRMGVGLQSLTPQLAEYFGLEERAGALVASVREETPAADAGLRAGDVIVSIAGEEVESPRDVIRAVRGAEAGSLEVVVVRDGSERSLTVELPEREEEGPFGGDLHIEVDIDEELGPRLEALGEHLGALGERFGEALNEELGNGIGEIEHVLRAMPRIEIDVPAPPAHWIHAAPAPPGGTPGAPGAEPPPAPEAPSTATLHV